MGYVHPIIACLLYLRALVILCALNLKDNIVSPSILRLHFFTTLAVDNVDYNPSSRPAKESIHGTAITTTQHLEHVGDGNQRQIYPFEKRKG